MKYLKRFNESSDNSEIILNTLIEEAKDNLAFLLDNDWDVTITENGIGDDYYYFGGNINYTEENEFGGLFCSWKSVKEEILPYLELLINKYNVKDEFNVYYLNKNDEDVYDEFSLNKLNKKNFKISEIFFDIKIKKES
jgi:hypothetical protein